MPSALAAQLAQGASLNAAQLLSRSRKRKADSYLFSSREAEQHDLESIHALGVNGFTRLKAFVPSLAKFEDILFSDVARDVDRTLLPKDEILEYDRAIASVLRLLSPHILESPTGKVLEWLVRRFRINEFNVDDVISCFLPFHESSSFVQMLSILHIKQSSMWAFINPAKTTGKPLPREILVSEMVSNLDVARFVTSLLPSALDASCAHRVLIGFNAAILTAYINATKTFSEGVLAFLLPSLTKPLRVGGNKDCILASFILLAQLSQKSRLSRAAQNVILLAVLSARPHVGPLAVLQTFWSICSTQEQMDIFEPQIVTSLTETPSFHKRLSETLGWRHSEKVLRPLVRAFIKRLDEPHNVETLAAIINWSETSADVIRSTTILLFEKLRADEAVSPLLSAVYQRHPDTFREVANHHRDNLDAPSRDSFERFMISLSFGTTSLQPEGDLSSVLLAVVHTDPAVRVTGVRRALENLATLRTTGTVNSTISTSMEDAVLARLEDTHPSVISEIYKYSNTLLNAIPAQSLLTSIQRSVRTEDFSRASFRSHLSFLAGDFSVRHPPLMNQIFCEIIAPFLLFTKPRQKTASALWEVLADSPLGNYELLKGCAPIMSDIQGKEDSSVRMGQIDVIISGRIADNIRASDLFAHHLDFLMSRLAVADAHIRILATLVLRALLSKLTGEHQISVALRTLEVLGVNNMEEMGPLFPESKNFVDLISDETLGQAVFAKPSSLNTTLRLQASILALLPVIPRPTDVKLDWLAPKGHVENDMRGWQFVELTRSIYVNANSVSSLHAGSINLLRALFVNLGDDSLLFLAGIWSHTSYPDDIRAAALLHGNAFLAAQMSDNDRQRDFQVILPSLLIAFHSDNRRIRERAGICVRMLAGSNSAQRSNIYGFESIYGDNAAHLQYLDWLDFQQYVKVVADHCEHFISDADYFAVFQRDTLRITQTDTKKESGHKQRVLCYLFSHVLACRDPRTQLTILKTVRHISDSVKLPTLFPLMKELMKNKGISGLNEADKLTFSEILFGCYDATSIPALEEPRNEYWPFFLEGLQLVNDAATPPWLRPVALQQLERLLFTHLKQEYKSDVCTLLIQLAVTAPTGTSYSLIKGSLKSMLVNIRTITHLLKTLQPNVEEVNQRASKRPRMDKDNETPEGSLTQLTVLVEVITSIPLPGHLQLVSSLLETMGTLVQLHIARPDVDYLEQLILGALESVIANIAEVPSSLSTLRVDVLVELIRVTENPQTFQQALLLIGSMTRLSSDSVLHNVMPIFTFMGANVFHRDDSYSFRVVQKTVESIVPVFVTDLKQRHQDPFGLYLAGRDFLRVFTDAANHVPKHRRNHFYSLLVSTLGPDDFLSAVCMLLVDKNANRVSRQKNEDVTATLTLPLLLLQEHPVPVRLKVFNDLLGECERLVARMDKPDTPAFLEQLSEHEDHSLPITTLAKRQIVALIIFVGHAWSQISSHAAYHPLNDGRDVDVQMLVAALLRLTIARTDALDPADINKAASLSLSMGLHVVPAADFLAAILRMIETADDRITIAALRLLSERLKKVSAKSRASVAATMTSITVHLQQILAATEEFSPLLEAILIGLQVISDTASTVEEGLLATIVPLLIQIGDRGITSPNLFKNLQSLTVKLGPRVIPNLKSIILLCVRNLRQNAAGAVLDLLSALLETLPSFWGPELLSVLQSCLELAAEGDGPLPSAVNDLLAHIPARIPSRTILPTLVLLWDDLSSSLIQDGTTGKLGAYLNLLKNGVVAASRADALDHIRSLFKAFLEIFDLRGDLPLSKDVPIIEDACIEVFLELVAKLNETSFKPIFRRLHDWAFTTADETKVMDRRITFCRIMSALLEMYKGLMSPYMATVQASVVDVLQTFSHQTSSDSGLWASTIQMLQKSFAFDEGAFWKDERLEKILPTLVDQILVWKLLDGTVVLPDALADMAHAITKEALLKSLNLKVLMQTRSEDPAVRLSTLACAEAIWEREGMRMIGLTSDCIPFISECAEDDNDEIAKEARKLKRVLENFSGRIDL